MKPSLTIYKASAGSGKTYTLALEYIRTLLGIKTPESGTYSLNSEKYCGRRQPSRHRHILAITFTNKATEEMKQRIINELHGLADGPGKDGTDANYAATLTECFGCTRDELAKASQTALEELLYDYGGFNISTIDSFFQQVLREFAREVDRQGDFEVELDDTVVIDSGISMMLDDLNYGEPKNGPRMQKWIYDYMINRISESGKHNFLDRGSSLFTGLVKFVEKSCSEDYKEHADKLREYLADSTKLPKFRQALRNAIKRQDDSLKRSARAVVDALGAEGYGTEVLWRPKSYIEAVLKGEEPTNDGIKTATINSLAAGIPPFNQLFSGSKCRSVGRGKTKQTIFPSSAVEDSLVAFAREYLKTYVVFGTYRPTLVAADNLEFLGFALNYIEQFRRENNLILLSDTNDLLGRIINDDDAPFIYERLGVYLNHFLIDEFQDTSRMQWQNLRPLVGSGVKDYHDSLIIGDEKQAIYRFRNSDASMLHSTVADDDFPTHSRVRGDAPGENTNYRSAPDVVRFNNTVFERMAAALGVAGFENVIQALPKKDVELPAYIRVAKFKTEEDSMEIMARNILRQHDEGKYQWRDIAILVRRARDAAVIVEFLRTNYKDIKVLSDEALYLRNSASVKLIVGMLKLLDRACTDDSLKKISASKTDIMAMNSRFDYYIGEGYTPEEALHLAIGDNADPKDMDRVISRLREMHASSLTSIVEQIIRQRIPAKQRKDEMAFICAFQDMVADYCKKFPDSLHDFVKWYDKFGRNKALPAIPGQDAVQVMTVHKAKGLEWDCVHIPFANWRLNKPDEEIWFSPAYPDVNVDVTPPLINITPNAIFGMDYSPYQTKYREVMLEQVTDNLNTTYVAYTRAARELIVGITPGSGNTVGDHVLEVLQMAATLEEAADGLHVDTAGHFVEPTEEDPMAVLMEIGEPTEIEAAKLTKRLEKEAEEKATRFELDDYDVFDRDDTRELVAIPDILSELDNIDNETPAELEERAIVDPIPQNADEATTEKCREAARRGILLHAVMAEMNSRSDLDTALGRVSYAAALSPEETESLRSLLTPALESGNEYVDRWFDPDGTVLSEQSILLPGGEFRRPDRIVIHTDGSVDLVDYKFTNELHKSHQEQLRDYCIMLRSMGYDRVSGHLWYPLLGKIATEEIIS